VHYNHRESDITYTTIPNPQFVEETPNVGNTSSVSRKNKRRNSNEDILTPKELVLVDRQDTSSYKNFGSNSQVSMTSRATGGAYDDILAGHASIEEMKSLTDLITTHEKSDIKIFSEELLQSLRAKCEKLANQYVSK
jgi:hypothetical protein